ncbi:MAG: uroporphyrinogen-III C-methyltransferase, partial [Hyphomicrobiales bacterium]|nr:uroporphyrinogen-III C-methyltransferase [Hyphomicrobiales bacterium]
MTDGEDGDAGPDLIRPLETLPVFLRARGRRMIVVGGADGAAWKAELLAAAGARVDVFALDPSERMERLAAARPEVALLRRAWSAADFAGALAVVAQARDDDEARAVVAAARA